MSRRDPHWVKLFLHKLERTGNVRLAASHAGVDFTTAYQRRKRHGEFAEAWEGALGAHKAMHPEDVPRSPLRYAESPSPPEGGEGTVTRPDGKVVKGSDARWGKRAETRFLAELTVSANVRRAAEAAGFSTTAVYQRRLKSRHFAAAWDAALESGRARVQAYLVEAASRTFDPEELPIGDQHELPKVSVSEAINIAKLGPASGAAKSGRGFEDSDGEFVTNQEFEEARERITERLVRLKENMDAEERETGRCFACGQVLRNLTSASESA